MKVPNPTVGTVPCPLGEAHTCEVHRFRQTAATDARRRKAGKFYLRCAVHGRIGFDCDPWIQEWVLERITWSDESARLAVVDDGGAKLRQAIAAAQAPSKSSSPRSPPSSSAAARPAARPASTSTGKQTATQTQTTPAAKRPWWEDL